MLTKLFNVHAGNFLVACIGHHLVIIGPIKMHMQSVQYIHSTTLAMIMDKDHFDPLEIITNSYFTRKFCFHLHMMYIGGSTLPLIQRWRNVSLF